MLNMQAMQIMCYLTLYMGCSQRQPATVGTPPIMWWLALSTWHILESPQPSASRDTPRYYLDYFNWCAKTYLNCRAGLLGLCVKWGQWGRCYDAHSCLLLSFPELLHHGFPTIRDTWTVRQTDPSSLKLPLPQCFSPATERKPRRAQRSIPGTTLCPALS